MINSLFVYGTLAPGKENDRFLKPLLGRWQTAYIKGSVYPKGLPATRGYPALRLSDEGEKIKGKVFTCLQLLSVFPTLDAFEGEGYIRTEAKIYFVNGSSKMAYVYAYDERFIDSQKP